MKKKIRYDRLSFVIGCIVIFIMLFAYMVMHRNHYYEYQGEITTYIGTYEQDDKIYTFDLKAFQEDNQYYLSLNDMYNMIILLDKNTKVYFNQNKHTLTYQMSDITYYFDYGQNQIVYNNECIDLDNESTHIYISHKNIYISVSFIEKLLLKNEKKIKFENKNAIIS